MSIVNFQPALLVLSDGTSYQGYSCGAKGTSFGEVVFNTGITGYQEVMTDPSYRGQIVTFTYPELGNTGVNPEDEESSQPHVKGIIARNICDRPSNWRSTQSLPDYLKAHHIIGLYGIDTRDLTRRLRTSGAMNGAISTEILEPDQLLIKLQSVPSMAGLNLVKEVTTDKIYEWTEPTNPDWEFSPRASLREKEKYTVVAIDFGVKLNILRRLASYGCKVIVVPANTPPEEILKFNPDGIFLSNGPGDPSAVAEGITTAKALLKAEKPMFGICMGHQILGLSLGAETFKLKFGHRGLNQPAGLQQKVEITRQNHKKLPLFSVQYHPEASPGPHDADYLFEQFVKMMRDHK